MAESYAGITVPEGHPEQIHAAARTFHAVANGLHGASGDLRSVPGLVADWQGPASAAFDGTTITNGGAVDDGAGAMGTCAQAANTYADALEKAQKEARRAIHDAQDAQRRIDQANADIEDAAGAQVNAQNQIDSADQAIAMSTGVDAGAMADRDAGYTALNDARNAEGDARRRLQQAQDDLADAKKRGHQAEEDAKDAARTATGAFESVAGHTPAAAVFGGSPTGIESSVLARVRAGDYTVLDQVPYNYLPEDTQKAIAAEIAKESYKASYGKGSHSMGDMASLVRRYEDDEQFATGFYNQLGGGGAYDLASNTYFFHGHGKGLQDPSVVALLAPFAALMSTATRSKDLRRDFTDDFIGTDVPLKDRLGSQGTLAAFVMAAPASGYSSKFLSRIGKDILVDPLDDPNVPGIVDISDHQDFMKFLAGNPEASGLLLAGHHGPGDHLSNAATLILYGPRYTDDGDALGAMITAGAHDLRATDMPLANQAAHAIVQTVPELHQSVPDGAKPSLVTILDDHVEDLEYLATERANPGLLQHHPDNFMSGLNYDESEKYLKTLIGYDETRGDATKIVGDRVGYDVYMGAGQGDTQYMNRAGALSEMGVIATAEADLDHAKTLDAMNGFAESATDKALGFTPLKKIPFANDLVGKGLHQLFDTDHVEKALTEQAGADLNAYQHIKQLSVSAQVAYGNLPPEALQMLKPDGEIDISFVHGAHGDQDLIPRDANLDGVPDGGNVTWDIDGDGKPETITERDLYNLTLGPAEAGADSMANLRDATWDQAHPPDIDDLKVPGYDQDNPNTFEKVMSWPFDAPGEGTISHDGHVVAHQDDLHWNPDERVYTLDVDNGHGGTTELHYQRGDDDKWELVKKVGDKWMPVD